ncbi:MAG: acyltransferase domain-containing protein [Chitinophagaceae bacterium]|nr:acyltransferase domain-containing protein [Oligoflexus sp.]
MKPKVQLEAIQFGRKHHLVGVLHRVSGARYAAIFWNTGISSRVGPFRGNVQAAEALAEEGYSVLRFDIAQMGESGDPGETVPIQDRTSLDLKDALDAVTAQCGITEFILVGICSSALDSYYFALKEMRIRAIFMIDSLVYPTVRHRIGYALERMGSAFRWKRLIKKCLARFTNFVDEEMPPDYFEGNYPSPEEAALGFQSLVDRGIDLHLIYTGGFTPFYSYREQFFDMLPGLAKVEKIEVHYWKDVDHLFMLHEDRIRYIERLSQWLAKILPAKTLSLTAPTPAAITVPAPLEEAPPVMIPNRTNINESILLKTIVDCFNRTLAPTAIEADDSFFDYGGSSVLAIRAVHELSATLDLDIPVVAIYTYMQASVLAKAILRGEYSARSVGEHAPSEVSTYEAPALNLEDSHESIAIIGMACHVPGAKNVADFWKMIMNGVEGITHFSKDELDASLPSHMTNHPQYVASRGVIEGDRFDAPFFRLSKKEAMLMDPQQRILLETSWQALEDAGYSAHRSEHRIAVYAGLGGNTYLTRNLSQGHFEPHTEEEFMALLLNDKDDVAMRVAYHLNLKGPAVSVHTACSTSLVAVIEAIKTLLAGQADIALAGGSSVTAPLASGHLYQDGGIFSKDGHCRPFDAKASGTLFSDGSAVVVLKKLSYALRDSDHVYAVIKGWGMNNDGADKSSYAAPSVQGQELAIRDALSVAGIDASTLGYVECHGTATPIGDPIELEALRRAYVNVVDKNCALGSTKAHLGHLTAAAGAIGLIKASLAIQEAIKPALLHFTEAHPNIRLDKLPFYIPKQNEPWRGLRRAGVSSFGVGGTNAHLILEQAPPRASKPLIGDTLDPWITLKWSAARDVDAAQIRDNLKPLASSPEILDDISYTLGLRAKHKWVGAATLLASQPLFHASPIRNKPTVSRLIFVFPGQGSQYQDMGLELAKSWPRFGNRYAKALAHFKSLFGLDLHAALHDEALLSQTQYTQTALFVLEWSLASCLLEIGYIPHALLGHSLGELTAATLAGVFSFEDAATLVFHRARLMQTTPKGLMLAVRASLDTLQPLLGEHCELAAENTEKGLVVSGSIAAVEALEKTLAEREIAFRRLNVSQGFHSFLMESVLGEFRSIVQTLTLKAPEIQIISTVTGKVLTTHEALSPDYWVQQIRKPVLFHKAIQFAEGQSDSEFLELGPRDTLMKFINQSTEALAVASLPNRGQSETEDFGLFLSELALGNHAPFQAKSGHITPLAPYPFHGERYWLEPLTLKSKNALSRGAKTKLKNRPAPMKQSQTHVEAPMANHPLVFVLAKLLDQTAESIDVKKSWNELGLDSLLLTQWSLKLQRDFSYDISLRRLQSDIPNLESLITTFAPVSMTRLAPERHEAEQLNDCEVDGFSELDEGAPTASGHSVEAMQRLMSEQIRLMNRQLDIMGTMLGQIAAKPEPKTEGAPVLEKAVHTAEPLVWKTFHTDRGEQKVKAPERAFLGLDIDGQPALFLEDLNTPGQFLKIEA